MRIITGAYVVLCLILSITFINIGYSDSTVHGTITIGGWMHTGDADSTDSKYVCSDGRLVGDIWETDIHTGIYGLHIYDLSGKTWDKIEDNFKDEQFAKQAAEKFINTHKVCQ